MGNGVGETTGDSTSRMLQTEQVEMDTVNSVSRVREMIQCIIAHPLNHSSNV